MSPWYELVIEGREDDVRELLPGVATDGEHPYWGEDLDLQGNSLPDRLRELLGARTHHLLFVPGTQVGPLTRAIEGKPEIRLERVREIASGCFSFEAEAYSPEVAARIKRVLHGPLPPEVVLETSDEKEREDPEAKGVELYSPVHDFVYRCRGSFSGPPPGIFEIHRTLQGMDFVHPEKLELEGREVEAEKLG